MESERLQCRGPKPRRARSHAVRARSCPRRTARNSAEFLKSQPRRTAQGHGINTQNNLEIPPKSERCNSNRHQSWTHKPKHFVFVWFRAREYEARPNHHILCFLNPSHCFLPLIGLVTVPSYNVSHNEQTQGLDLGYRNDRRR